MKGKRKIFLPMAAILLILSLVLLLPKIDYGRAEDFSDIIPLAKKISPKRSSYFALRAAFYNPLIERYVVFFDELRGSNYFLWSRVLNKKLKPVKPLYQLFSGDISEFLWPTGVYNERDNEFFFVWMDIKFDKISGVIIDGQGRRIYSIEPVVIKESSGDYTGFFPQACWIPELKQYAVAWTHWDPYSPDNPKNGFYMATVNPNLKIVVTPKKVKQQTIRVLQFWYLSVIPVKNRLLWGSVEDQPGGWLKPIAWFTNFKGRMLSGSNQDTGNVIYPGKKVKGRGWVKAAYNPSDDLIFLYWNASDHTDKRYQTYRENYYRLMDSNGIFKTKMRKLPKKKIFQDTASVIYNPAENRFFAVYPEYKILYQQSSGFPYFLENTTKRELFRGKIWGLYINNKGDAEGKGKNPAIPLTDIFTDPDLALYLEGLVYNPMRNDYFVSYQLHNFVNDSADIWGLIYE